MSLTTLKQIKNFLFECKVPESRDYCPFCFLLYCQLPNRVWNIIGNKYLLNEEIAVENNFQTPLMTNKNLFTEIPAFILNNSGFK
jgi:hypothetical protein